ncbi:hypothetical protein [Nafulsella turpanensis]|uniref:hypothetical protein n=1 Tax=Nafulsella turpanensis TaxID=1265690 RepID=UPI000345115D|nr:hypothetical protein [Nafulsella turpanensis]
MKNKLPFYFFWDKKSILWLLGIAFLIISLISFVFIPEMVYSFKLKQLKGETKGQVISIKENTTMRQGRYGNKIVVESYLVNYQYMVNNHLYWGQNTLSGLPKVQYALKKIIDSEFKRTVKVRYDIEKPSKSMIALEYLFLNERKHPATFNFNLSAILNNKYMAFI